ncbi:MAG: DinB family protein, partial [Gemmatimonadaceae bacterium]
MTKPTNRKNLKNPENLQNLLREAYAGPAWHGPTLSRSVRGVSAEQAEWRPGRGRHNIREIVVHAAFWKHAVRCRLLGRRRTEFPLAGRNWFAAPHRRPWRDDLRLLADAHRALAETVAAYPPRALNRVV